MENKMPQTMENSLPQLWKIKCPFLWKTTCRLQFIEMNDGTLSWKINCPVGDRVLKALSPF